MTDILICGTWRCGSTMVCEDLTLTGVLGRPEEYLNRWDEHAALDWKAEFQSVRDRCTTDNGVFSVKLMASHLRKIDVLLSTFSPPSNVPYFPHVVGAFRDPFWVHIKRRDRVAQAISSYVAVKTNVYHLVGSRSGFRPGKASSDRPPPVVYDYQEIMRHWLVLQQHELIWEQFFAAANIKPLTIWYEDVADSSAAPLIAESVGVSISDTRTPRNLRKLANAHNDALREAFLMELMSGKVPTFERHAAKNPNLTGGPSFYRRLVDTLPEPLQIAGSRLKRAFLPRSSG